MNIVKAKVLVELELTLEERDTLCNWILRELGDNSNVDIPMEVYDFLKWLGAELAPDWC